LHKIKKIYIFVLLWIYYWINKKKILRKSVVLGRKKEGKMSRRRLKINVGDRSKRRILVILVSDYGELVEE